MVVNLRWVGRGAFTVGLLWHLWPSGTFMVTDKFFWFFCWSICAVFVHQNIVIFSTFTPSQCLYRFRFSLFLHIEFSIQLNGYFWWKWFYFSFLNILYFCILKVSSSVGIFGGGLCFEDLKRWQAWSHRFDHQNNKFQIAGCFRFLV